MSWIFTVAVNVQCKVQKVKIKGVFKYYIITFMGGGGYGIILNMLGES